MKFNNRNVWISPTAKIGNNVRIGDNSTIYDHVSVGDGTVICNDCVIGEPSYSYYSDPDNYANPETLIGKGSFIRSHCVLYSGSTFGEGLVTGHGAIVREHSTVGNYCLISSQVDIQGQCIIGNYSRIYSSAHISERTELGSYVFVYPYTIFTNDPQPPSDILEGAKVGDFSIITVHCVVLPGVQIGTHCLIGANSVISRDIPDYSFAMGTPAKRIKDIRTIPSKGDANEAFYPWPRNFDRGMPWKTSGFDEWSKELDL